jgi:nitroreductase
LDVFEAIQTRRSIRSYKKSPVENAKLVKILEAARLAPSACNFQPWKFIVITNPEVKENLRSAYDEEWFTSAPVIIVACAVLDEAWNRKDGEEYWKVDVTIALQNLILAAWEENLGTCWIGAFDEKQVKKILDISDQMRVVAMTPLGYPAEQKEKVTDRKSLDEIMSYIR